MPKTVICPYFKYEADGKVVCAGGKLELLQKKEVRDDYINTYCASFGYRHCSIARVLERYYETHPTKQARPT